MFDLVLTKPNDEYKEEIRDYRQELIDAGSHFNGDSGLRKFEDINAWIQQCRLLEQKETVPNPDWVEADQFILVRNGDRRVSEFVKIVVANHHQKILVC